jgi:hypothetical protein
MVPVYQQQMRKFRQYKYGYCSVKYAAADDKNQFFTYAVCDHRLDGAALAHVVADHFGTRKARIVPEIVLTEPRTSFDFAALSEDDPNDVIAIETQAMDIRGGGVGPAWRAWADRKVELWRGYFTEEARLKGRKDTVAYGVNMANVYKRLGLQVAVKGSYLKGIGVPFYVLMQDRPFQYLRRRINFTPVERDWDITFVTFDYGDFDLGKGAQIEFSHRQTVRTSLLSYVAAMSADANMGQSARADFFRSREAEGRLERVICDERMDSSARRSLSPRDRP